MFTFSKLFWMVASPSNLLALLLLCGTLLLFTRYRRSGRFLVAFAMSVMTVLAVFPIGYLIVENLEDRFPGNPPLPENVAGIIALGGTVNAGLTEARGQPAMTEGGERLIEFVRLGRQYPTAKLIFSGGSGSLTRPDLKEAKVAKAILDSIGFSESRIVYEDRSRNTHENALYTLKLADPAPGDVWILVTSAAHMPRAVGAFRAAGWTHLLPYPVDYTTDGTGDFSPGFNPFGGVRRFTTAMREWTGLLAYRILGRTDTLYPGPKPLADN